MNSDSEMLREQVRRKYAAASKGGGDCCGEGSCGAGSDDLTGGLYGPSEPEVVPAAFVSLGCGNPTAVAELQEGETVLDLGSGGGLDVLLSARRVGDTGFVYGLDMTEEMLALARANSVKAGATNVEFLPGYIEEIPLPGGEVDVIVSNCVINLSADKPAVFGEMYRVLRPGGRVAITDIVADDALDPEQRAERGSWVGCIAGALSRNDYRDGLRSAGFVAVDLTPAHPVADGLYSMIIRATKPV